jgi:hypothetical protein
MLIDYVRVYRRSEPAKQEKRVFFGLTADTFLAYASRNSRMKPVSWVDGGRGADPGRESSYEI